MVEDAANKVAFVSFILHLFAANNSRKAAVSPANPSFTSTDTALQNLADNLRRFLVRGQQLLALLALLFDSIIFV